MNHIARLTQERDTAQQTIRETRDALLELMRYLLSEKFRGDGNDYVHVRTDILPKIQAIQFSLCGK